MTGISFVCGACGYYNKKETDGKERYAECGNCGNEVTLV
jgi:DNA-directed RNA polymerase subunit RPC12/RpoP